MKNKNIDNLNFDSYFRTKYNYNIAAEKNRTMEEFKKEYENLYSEVTDSRKHYIKLQEALIYLKTNNLENFYESTFDSLKKILLQEIKIANYKTRLFYRLMLNSQVKDYFKLSNNNIFKDVNIEDEEEINIINNSYKVANNSARNNKKTDIVTTEQDLSVFIGGYETIKENLFLTKSKIQNSK